MQYSRFSITSRENALRSIRRTSGFFIWVPVIIVGLGLFEFFDAWLHSHVRAETSASPPEALASLIAFMLGKIVRNDWLYILVLMNGIFLRRYKSRVAALSFVLVSLYGVGLGLYMIWTMLSEHVSQHLLLLGMLVFVISTMCFLVAARALTAAVKLQREFVEHPVSSLS